MKATIAVLFFLVAVAYTIVVEAKSVRHAFDPDALDPKCVKPENCPGDDKEVSYYDPYNGCQLIKLGKDCSDNDNYPTLALCKKHCPPAPGTQPGRA
uniref:Putative tick kunitz 60 n=1 Tax=Ixodes ricinus TaxID=34613 RepID=V5HK50_IXORI